MFSFYSCSVKNQLSSKLFIFVQGVPQLSSHFVLVVFSASRTRSEEYFTIFQQPRRRRFQNSPYFPPYVKKWSIYSTKRETNWILKVSFWWQILILFRGVCQLQGQLSQPFLNQFSKFLCPFCCKFPEFFETPILFLICMIMKDAMDKKPKN